MFYLSYSCYSYSHPLHAYYYSCKLSLLHFLHSTVSDPARFLDTHNKLRFEHSMRLGHSNNTAYSTHTQLHSTYTPFHVPQIPPTVASCPVSPVQTRPHATIIHRHTSRSARQDFARGTQKNKRIKLARSAFISLAACSDGLFTRTSRSSAEREDNTITFSHASKFCTHPQSMRDSASFIERDVSGDHLLCKQDTEVLNLAAP